MRSAQLKIPLLPAAQRRRPVQAQQQVCLWTVDAAGREGGPGGLKGPGEDCRVDRQRVSLDTTQPARTCGLQQNNSRALPAGIGRAHAELL